MKPQRPHPTSQADVTPVTRPSFRRALGEAALRWQMAVITVMCLTATTTRIRRASASGASLRRLAGAGRRRRHDANGDAGMISVESIGWIAIAVAVVGIVGMIVRAKLTAMANSLPDTLGW